MPSREATVFPREATEDHAQNIEKTIGFTVYFAFLTQKSDFQLGHPVNDTLAAKDPKQQGFI